VEKRFTKSELHKSKHIDKDLLEPEARRRGGWGGAYIKDHREWREDESIAMQSYDDPSQRQYWVMKKGSGVEET